MMAKSAINSKSFSACQGEYGHLRFSLFAINGKGSV
jgi:hypothetical protein